MRDEGKFKTVIINMEKVLLFFFQILILTVIIYIFYELGQYYSERNHMMSSVNSLLTLSSEPDSEKKIKILNVQNELKTQDFITIVTGLLTLIIGAVGIGSYISFKKIKEEENRFHKLGDKFEALLQITGSSTFDPLTATGDDYTIRLYNEIERKNNEYGLLYVLRGEEYYYKKMYGEAIDDFVKALDIDSTLARAWFGWGQTLFKISSTLENMPKHEKIWNFKTFYEKSRFLKMHNSDLKISREKAKEPVAKIEKARICGYEKSKVNFEIGRIHEAMMNGDGSDDLLDIAIEKYRTAYYLNNIDAGLYYCVAWIRKHRFEIIANGFCADIKNIVMVLKEISNSFHKSMVCALLCYLYCIAQKKDDARRMFQETNDMAINELFYIEDRNSEGAPCSSSQA